MTKERDWLSFFMRKIWNLALLLPLLLIACASDLVNWNGRVGQYTYDDVIRELGVPDRSATLTDGTVVAEWLHARGQAYATSFGVPRSRIQSYDITQFPDRYLRLTFSPNDFKLQRAEQFAR